MGVVSQHTAGGTTTNCGYLIRKKKVKPISYVGLSCVVELRRQLFTAKREILTSGINDIHQCGLPVSHEAVGARVKQLQLEGLWFGGNLLRASVDHNVLLHLSWGQLDQAGEVETGGVCAPVNGGGVFQTLSADHRDGVERIRYAEVLRTVLEHDHTRI